MNLLATGGTMGWEILIMYVVIIGGFMYFAAIRPQNKEKKRVNAMLSS
ncbi:MAG: preprotein translocase subunit YajC, partial [Oscillospiraceae bacterium]|nr:preprotein translocase subunit YajC [Oscillospiraceae bacterium]